jgi:hypothetical protein
MFFQLLNINWKLKIKFINIKIYILKLSNHLYIPLIYFQEELHFLLHSLLKKFLKGMLMMHLQFLPNPNKNKLYNFINIKYILYIFLFFKITCSNPSLNSGHKCDSSCFLSKSLKLNLIVTNRTTNFDKHSKSADCLRSFACPSCTESAILNFLKKTVK